MIKLGWLAGMSWGQHFTVINLRESPHLEYNKTKFTAKEKLITNYDNMVYTFKKEKLQVTKSKQ